MGQQRPFSLVPNGFFFTLNANFLKFMSAALRKAVIFQWTQNEQLIAIKGYLRYFFIRRKVIYYCHRLPKTVNEHLTLTPYWRLKLIHLIQC